MESIMQIGELLPWCLWYREMAHINPNLHPHRAQRRAFYIKMPLIWLLCNSASIQRNVLISLFLLRWNQNMKPLHYQKQTSLPFSVFCIFNDLLNFATDRSIPLIGVNSFKCFAWCTSWCVFFLLEIAKNVSH